MTSTPLLYIFYYLHLYCTLLTYNGKPRNEKITGENTNLDPETAKRLFEVGAHLILLNVPLNTEIGVDMNSWNTGPNFKGIKMIPPGVHFIYWR